jgi:hypothetical protein
VIHYEASHAVLLTGINMREAMQGECADKSVAAGRWEPVGGAAVLGIKVEDAVWQRPIERKEAPKFGACEVGYEQALRSAVERGAAQGQELVTPEPNAAAIAHRASDHAHGPGAFTGWSLELKVHTPNLAERREGGGAADPRVRVDVHVSPRKRRITG